MCGIAGIIGDGATEHVEAMGRMLSSMVHRGPDGGNTYASPTGQCLLGHRRLSIIDLSPAAAQPMTFANQRWTITYNGECYNYDELRLELLAQGHSFVSTGDTEVVLHLLAQQAADALPRINGMFALALWDEAEQSLLLARDRFGQKPVYYFWNGKLFIFASEIRALLSSGLVPRVKSSAAIRSYLSYGTVSEPETIVKDVKLLPVRSYLSFKLPGSIEMAAYESLVLTDKLECSSEELQSIFFAAVSRHMVSDAPLGLFLSGGLDSSAVTVAAVANRTSGTPVKTLSVVFPDSPHLSEADQARAIAVHAKTEHCEIAVTSSEIIELLPKALDSLDQPTVDGVNVFLVAHAAHQIGLKVVLSGVGADELFGGYSSFGDLPRINRIRRLLGSIPSNLARLTPAVLRRNYRIDKLIDVLTCSNYIVSLLLARRRIFSTNAMTKLMPSDNGEALTGLSLERTNALRELVDGLDLLDAVGVLELECYMSQVPLRDADVMGMANSLEIRCPFLDREFSTRALALPSLNRKPGAVPKWKFAMSMLPFLPEGHVQRPKAAFRLPFDSWLSGPLKNWTASNIEDLAGTELLDAHSVRQIWQNFLESPAQIGWDRPWALLVLNHTLNLLGLH